MNIQKRGNSYRIKVFLGYDENNKQITKSVSYTPKETAPTKIKKEVEAFAHDFENKVKNGEYYDGNNMTFSDFVEVWERDYAKDNISESILEGYKDNLNLYVLGTIGHLQLSKIKAPNIQSIYTNMKNKGLSPSTIKRVHAIISGIMKMAYKWELIESNPCSRCSLPKSSSTKELQTFSVEQTERFLTALTLTYTKKVKAQERVSEVGKKFQVSGYEQTYNLPTQFIVYFNLAIYSGCRRGELIALQWKDIDYKHNSISITKSMAKTKAHGQIVKPPKTKSGNRVLTLPQHCFDLLKLWKREQKQLCEELGSYWKGKRDFEYNDNFIFIQDNGEAMNLDTPSHKFKEIIDMYNNQYCEKEPEKLPYIRLHDLRHTNATLLISQNMDIATVSKRLGHSKTSVTLDIYTHALAENDEKASNVLEELLHKKA